MDYENFFYRKDLCSEEKKNQLFFISKANAYAYGFL